MRQLLVIQPSALGDIVHALQTVAALKARQPDWRVSWIVRDIFAPLVRASTVVDQVYVFRRHGGVRGFFQLMREVRAQEFDVALDLQGLLRSALMLQRTRARKKFGRADAREGAPFFYPIKVGAPARNPAHQVERLLEFCAALGAEPKLAGPLEFRDAAKLNLGFMDARRGLRPILIFPDTRREERRWNGFSELSALLVREAGRKVVWAGTNYVPCKEAFPDGAFLNLTGNTSLTSLTSLVGAADWVISNESGAMHLSAAMGVKTIGIFGPTDPRVRGPYPLGAATNHVIQAPVGDLRLLPAKDVFARFRRIEAFLAAQSR
jgi:ADP-heptose:LPS heptosyltransferase